MAKSDIGPVETITSMRVDLEGLVHQVIRKEACLSDDERPLRLSDRLNEDVGLESIDFLSLAFQLEQAFTIRIVESDWRLWKTVGDVVRDVRKRLIRRLVCDAVNLQSDAEDGAQFAGSVILRDVLLGPAAFDSLMVDLRKRFGAPLVIKKRRKAIHLGSSIQELVSWIESELSER